jgi:hypothetical protein
LEDDDIAVSGDKVLWIVSPTTPTGGEILDTIIGSKKVSWWLSDIVGVDKCVIRRLPQETKMIHGKLMRELGKDEIMQASDWIDYIGQYVHDPVGKPASFFSCPVYRPIKKG